MHSKPVPSWLITGLIALVVVLLTGVPALAIETGSVAPDFELETIEGKKVRLSDYRGQTILLKLATTWCPTCREQSDEIREVESALAEKKVAFIEVFLQDSEKMVRNYLEDESFEMVFVPLLDDGSALKAYHVYEIPRVLLIGPDFKVRMDEKGLVDADKITGIVEKIVK